MNNIIEINTHNAVQPQEGESILHSRKNAITEYTKSNECELSIGVLTYNRLNKTKECVESIIKNTDIPFKLFLLDNGSDNDVLEYFNSINHPNKVIIRVTKNIGSGLGASTLYSKMDTRYCAIVTNDLIITPNAIKNLLTCLKSDDKIGCACPSSSNVSNLQQIDLQFNSVEEMHAKAKAFNVSDPKKWCEMMRLITILFCYKKECMDIIGTSDYGFLHDFSDDDIVFRVRRAGYKAILCKDTWVHHNHDFRNNEDKDAKQFEKSINDGKNNFKDKYYGIDAWDDVCNFESPMISKISKPNNKNIPEILGVDTRCGTPLLEIKNKLRSFGVMNCRLNSFTTNAKYFLDLQTICDDVKCDRIEYLSDYYAAENFDYIIMSEPINMYNKALVLVQKMYDFLKPGGTLLFKLRNSYDVRSMLHLLGNINTPRDDEMPIHISLDDFCGFLNVVKIKYEILFEPHLLDEFTINKLKEDIKNAGQTSSVDETFTRLSVKDYIFCITK